MLKKYPILKMAILKNTYIEKHPILKMAMLKMAMLKKISNSKNGYIEK